MKRIVDHFLENKNRNIPIRTLGEQSLAAAIFAYENGGVKAVQGYVDRALSFCPDLEAEAKRLLPSSD